MKKLYVNLVTLILGIPLLFFAFMVFFLMKLGGCIVPDSWKLSMSEIWAINNWINDKGFYLHNNY